MLRLKNICKTYTRGSVEYGVISHFDLKVKNGEFIAIVGPSGCGKTTLLKIIAGLIPATEGKIILDGKIVSRPGKDRGMVFQQFSLFPWLTVKDNIAFGLGIKRLNHKEKETVQVHIVRACRELLDFASLRSKNKKYQGRQEKDKIVEHYLEITGLRDFAKYYPKHLSGGMQQRVAIARTLANDPKILLMDEPFGALDPQTKLKMQEFLLELWKRTKKTVIFITHDIEEAIFLAETVYVLSKRPASIKKAFKVPFGYPRKNAIKFTSKFITLRRKISEELD